LATRGAASADRASKGKQIQTIGRLALRAARISAGG
jgi:hypothetical protein